MFGVTYFLLRRQAATSSHAPLLTRGELPGHKRTFITRFIPKSTLPQGTVAPPPLTKKQEKALKEPLIKLMQRRQKEEGKLWPPNLRIEPILSRRATGNLQKSLRSKMKKLLTER